MSKIVVSKKAMYKTVPSSNGPFEQVRMTAEEVITEYNELKYEYDRLLRENEQLREALGAAEKVEVE